MQDIHRLLAENSRQSPPGLQKVTETGGMEPIELAQGDGDDLHL